MKEYKIKIKLKSPTLVGSGTGYGALIDTDVVYDELGIPFIPAKRIKGCLHDSAKDVKEMFDVAKISFNLAIEGTFGKEGAEDSAPVFFSNMRIDEFEVNKAWLEYFNNAKEFKDLFSKDLILDTFTDQRQQTKIDQDGVAFKSSLRTVRLLKKGIQFIGNISVENNNGGNHVLNTLLLSCMNFRSMGTKRNKGLGEIHCELYDGKKLLSIQNELEGLCIA